ncbi:hypothetical protein C8R44DRAFT_578135, partial [Mycena epipterygia]
MVGCSLLLQVSQALIEAKGNTALFGGVNIIFAGDFAQLPPVGMNSLYAKILTDTDSASGKKGQQNILGKLLWLLVKTVVILKKVERRCTNDDYDLLNSRLITNLRPDWSQPEFQHVPIIVSSNELKDALNEKAAQVFAARTGEMLHWYYAKD